MDGWDWERSQEACVRWDPRPSRPRGRAAAGRIEAARRLVSITESQLLYVFAFWSSFYLLYYQGMVAA